MKKFEEAGKALSLEAKAWIEAAEAAQAATEKEGGWKVQRPLAKEIEKEMRKAAASKAKVKALASTVTKTKPTQSIKEIFKPVEVRFKEVDTLPVKMETDSIDLCKMVIGEMSVFIVDDLVFDADGGKVGEHIGYYRNEEFFQL